MTNLLLQIGGTKLILSIILAGGVWVVHRRVGRCAVSYPLWLLVLIALLAPAVVALPVFPAVGSGVGRLVGDDARRGLVPCWYSCGWRARPRCWAGRCCAPFASSTRSSGRRGWRQRNSSGRRQRSATILA